MLSNELKLIFLILLIQNLKGQNFTPFKCFAKEAKQLGEKTPMQLVINDETIYLFYSDKIFKFDVPFVFQEYADYGEKGENYTAIIIKPAFVVTIKNLRKAKTVLDLVEFVYGYAHETRSNEKISYVIYSDLKNANISDFQFRRLKFNDLPGELGELDYKRKPNPFQFNGLVKIIFMRIDDKKHFQIIYFKVMEKYIYDFKFYSNSKYFKYIELNNSLTYEPRLAVYYEDYKENENVRFYRSLVEIDKKNVVHIKNYKITNEFHQTDIPISFYTFSLYLREFLNCKTPLESLLEIKGIFYRDETFFILINNYYLIVKQDLIESNFKLDRSVYANAKNLAFNHDKFNFSYYDRHTHFIKNFNDSSYLFINKTVFELELKKDHLSGDYLLAKYSNTRDLKSLIDCPRQLLAIDKYVFCFMEKTYYFKHFLLKNENITDIFADSDIQFSDEDNLRFIFKYKDEKIVFLTDKELIVFSFNLLAVNWSAKKIYVNKKNLAEQEYFRKPNCLIACTKKETFINKLHKLMRIVFGNIFMPIVLGSITFFLLTYLIVKRFKNKDEYSSKTNSKEDEDLKSNKSKRNNLLNNDPRVLKQLTNDLKAYARLTLKKLDMIRSTNQLSDQSEQTLKISTTLSTKFPRVLEQSTKKLDQIRSTNQLSDQSKEALKISTTLSTKFPLALEQSTKKLDQNRSTNQLPDQFKETLKISTTLSIKFPLNLEQSTKKLDINRTTNQLPDQSKEALKISTTLPTKFSQFSKKKPNIMQNAFSY